MSILQEYDEIRRDMGDKKFDSIDEYLKIICPNERIIDYNKKVNKLIRDNPDNWFDKIDNLKKDMNITMLDDVLYKKDEWNKFNNWYNYNKKHRSIKVLNSWNTDYGDIRYNVLMLEGNKEVANVICSYDTSDKDYAKSDIYDNWNKYKNLPRVSTCGRLTQEIYDKVCESESGMCYITDEEWNDSYKDDFNEKDTKRLKDDVKKYNLEDVITFNDGEYKILGYSDLETRFNDDRNLERFKEREER